MNIYFKRARKFVLKKILLKNIKEVILNKNAFLISLNIYDKCW